MSEQIRMPSSAVADEKLDHGIHEILGDVAYQRLAIVNVVFVGAPHGGDRSWVMIDAGIGGTTGFIRRAAANRFGEKSRPAAIVLTHGHFDHVGAVRKLADEWDAPIFAHEFEHPYLDGRASYPAPDPEVGGGMMARMSIFYPKGPIDVGDRLWSLQTEGTIPGMEGWRWIHTPGHTPGHVSLWREADRVLIAGDAVITTRQESAFAVATQRPELHGPPMYYTPDWAAARISVEKLSMLEPEVIVAGHGPAMQGPELRSALKDLARNFNSIALPTRGKYVNQRTGD